MVDHEAGMMRELATEGPDEFLLTGERLFATAVVGEPGAVLAWPRRSTGAASQAR